MPTVINNPPPREDGGGGLGFLLGVIVLVLLVVLFFIYGLPAIRGTSRSASVVGNSQGEENVEVPGNINVDINTNK